MGCGCSKQIRNHHTLTPAWEPWGSACAYLQPADYRPPVSPGSGGLAVRCAASDPDLHSGQPARVATLELEAEGSLTVEVDWKEVAGGRPSQTRNHHTLTPAWDPWGSPHAYVTTAGLHNLPPDLLTRERMQCCIRLQPNVNKHCKIKFCSTRKTNRRPARACKQKNNKHFSSLTLQHNSAPSKVIE